MKKSEQIREWLILVNDAQLAVATAKAQSVIDDVNAEFEVRKAGELLAEAFEFGLQAYGKAVVDEHLAEQTAAVA